MYSGLFRHEKILAWKWMRYLCIISWVRLTTPATISDNTDCVHTSSYQVLCFVHFINRMALKCLVFMGFVVHVYGPISPLSPGLLMVRKTTRNTDAISQTIFSIKFSSMKIYEIFGTISLTFVSGIWNKNIATLVHIMAWCRPGDKPLP